jgi:Ca2+-dependent lipid-binding protein
VIDDNLNPEWDEFYEAVVSQASGQRLRVELYDEDTGSNDEELGRLALQLDTIRDKGSIDQWYALDGVDRGQMQLKIYWLSLSRDPRDLEVDQWESEWLKANRTMHSALLMVYVDHATDLPFPKVGKEPSPYLTLELAGETKQTFPKFKTINPLWQEKFTFFMSHPEQQQLKIEAKDDNTKRSLGTCTISIGPILSERNLELYQQQFSLNLGTHQSPLVITVRLRPLKGRGAVAEPERIVKEPLISNQL